MPTALDTQHIEFTKALDAAPRTVFDQLIDEQHLRAWLAEHAQVEPRLEGAYRFWGRHTPLMPAASDAAQRITHLELGRTLGFSWPWGGTDSDVRIELHATPRGADLRLRHTLVQGTVAGFSRTESRLFVQDHWDVALANLRSYLRVGAPAIRPDYTRGPGDVARVSIEIDAPIDRVWRALTDPREMDKWLSTTAAADIRPGGAYSYGWAFDGTPCGPTRILEADPPRRLVHDWVYQAESPTRTEWTLEPLSPTRTRVTIEQIGIRTARDHTGYTGGWAKFASALKELMEA